MNKAGKAPALSLPCLRALLSFEISDGKQSRHRGEIPFSKMCLASGTEVMGVPEFLEAGVVRALDRLPSVLSHEGCCSLRPQGLGASFDHSESHLPLACEVHLLDRGPPFESRLFSRGMELHLRSWPRFTLSTVYQELRWARPTARRAKLCPCFQGLVFLGEINTRRSDRIAQYRDYGTQGEAVTDAATFQLVLDI